MLRKGKREASPLTITSLTPNHNQPNSRPSTASPPSPLRMERGVNTIVCKWRERFFDVRRGSSWHKETPFSNGEGRFVNSRILLPLFPLTILSHPTSSFHSPLHSERGWGWGFFSSGEGRSFNSRKLLPLFLFSITLQANSSHHAPLHWERGRGWGCRGLRVRLLFPSYCAIISLIIAMSFSSPKPERSPAEAIVAFLRMSFPSGEFSILKGV